MGLVVQAASLHRQNNSKQWMEEAVTNAMTMTVKQVVENTRKPPEESWWMKAPLCCVPLRVYMVSQGQGYFHSC